MLYTQQAGFWLSVSVQRETVYRLWCVTLVQLICLFLLVESSNFIWNKKSNLRLSLYLEEL